MNEKLLCFFLMAYLATGHSEHLVERYDGSSLMELHQVVQTAVAPVLPDYDALSVIWRIDHKVPAAVFSTEGGGRLNSSKGWRGPDFVRDDWGCVGCETANHWANSVPIWEGVADPALTDPDEEVTRKLGHQQHLCCPAQIINRHLAEAKQNKNSLYLSVSVNDLQSFREWSVNSNFYSDKRNCFLLSHLRKTTVKTNVWCCKLVLKKNVKKKIGVQKSVSPY